MSAFSNQLVAFNEMYGLPVNGKPTLLGSQRLKNLKAILQAELDEIDEIINKAELYEAGEKLQKQASEDGVPVQWADGLLMQMNILTDVADLMQDFQVYCGSEMLKWGIPIDAVRYIVMASNMSKLGADGKPIVDHTGKVQKGPGYWKPEPMIDRLLREIKGGNTNDPLSIAVSLVDAKTKRVGG